MAGSDGLLPLLNINGNITDPNDPAFQAADASGTDYIVLQSTENLSNEQQKQLADHGVRVQTMLDQNTFLCHYLPADLEPLRSLPFVQYVDVYRTLYVMDPYLKKKIPATNPASALQDDTQIDPVPDTPIEIDVIFHRGINDQNPQYQMYVASLILLAGVTGEDAQVTKDHVRLRGVAPSRLGALAEGEWVRCIEEVEECEPHIN